jgi:hypothetical protein
MSELDSTKKHHSAQCALEAPVIICQNDPQQDESQQDPTGHQVLYVLGFGIAGAILANMTLFLYFFSSFYPSG